jgi:MtN3 and saliva related transmembrane protein
MDDMLGYAAAICTTAAFVPQVVRVWRRRSADDISLAMYVLFMAGVALWAVYGVRVGALPVVIANVITFALASGVLAAKIRFHRRGGARWSAPPSRR